MLGILFVVIFVVGCVAGFIVGRFPAPPEGFPVRVGSRVVEPDAVWRADGTRVR